MKYVVRFVALLTLELVSGCYSYGIHTSAPSTGIEERQRGPVFLWGLVGQEKLAAQCDTGLARAESYMPWWGGIVGTLTLGTIIPWRVEYECAESHPPHAARVDVAPTPSF